MKSKLNTEVAIEVLVAATCGENAHSREAHVYRQALYSLVRLAKSEHMAELKNSVEKLTGTVTARAARRRAKQVLAGQRLRLLPICGQRQLEFNQG
jgi:hypothetical protein